MLKTTQVELKLDVAGEDAPIFLSQIGSQQRIGLTSVVPVTEQRIVDVYYDTEEGLLQKESGYLRERTVDDEPRLLTYRRSAPGMAVQQSIWESQWNVRDLAPVITPLRSDHPELPPPDADLPDVPGQLASMQLHPIAEVHMQREILRAAETEAEGIRVKLDRVSYPGYDTQFCQIEIDFQEESAAGAASGLYLALVRLAGPKAVPTTVGKLERGLLLRWLMKQTKSNT